MGEKVFCIEATDKENDEHLCARLKGVDPGRIEIPLKLH